MLKRFLPLVLIVLWVVPVGWVGLMRSNYPLYPAWISPLFRVSGIFESGPSRWRIFFIEVRDGAGWHYVDEKSIFAPTPLGDRTRFQPLMNEIQSSKSRQVSKLLEWIGHKLPKTNSSRTRIEATRIIYFDIRAETFLECTSLAESYQIAVTSKIPLTVVASQKIDSSSYENN